MLKSLTLLCACAFVLTDPASAQNWPSKPITLFVGTSAGGSLDLVSRVLAGHLEPLYKQPVVVENRVGAGGLLAGAAVVRAPADGHAFGIGMSPVTSLFVKDVPYAANDLVPAAMVGLTPYSIMVSSATGFKTLADFVAYAKAHPGKIDFGTVASTQHETEIVAMVRVLGIDANRIGYKGIAPIYQALMTGEEVQATISAFVPTQVKAGKITMLAIGGERRSADYPDVPTFRELGYDYNPRAYYTYFARTGTPRDILQRFSADVLEVVKSPDFNERVLKPFSVTPWLEGLDEGARVVDEDFRRQRDSAQRAGIKPQ
jgi:tripartite-type tricarboxylate transporter receptor subunit TctC